MVISLLMNWGNRHPSEQEKTTHDEETGDAKEDEESKRFEKDAQDAEVTITFPPRSKRYFLVNTYEEDIAKSPHGSNVGDSNIDDDRTDLKLLNKTWSDAFTNFMEQTKKCTQDIVVNIQYYYKCCIAADKEHAQEDEHWAWGPTTGHFEDDDDAEFKQEHDDIGEELSEEGLAALKAGNISMREVLHGCLAVYCAKDTNLFQPSQREWTICSEGDMCKATCDDHMRLKTWEAKMAMAASGRDTASTNHQSDTEEQDHECNMGGCVERMEDIHSKGGISGPGTINNVDGTEEALDAIDINRLKEDQ
ncbi:hypothetical protein CPB85DRAFT_1258568 [Mucidula mucida]|nr:hypothetical protein CPB85DRAFT_1258568 [Mucidula mucida]